MKTFLKIAGGIIILLIILLLGLSFYFNSARLKKMVVPRLNEAIGRPVSIDHISLSFFKAFPNPAVEIDSLSIPGKTESDTLLSVAQLAIGVKLFPLFGHRVVITELDLDEPNIAYIVYPDSSTNFDFLFSENETETDTTSSGYNISIPHFNIYDGHLKYIDSTSNTRAVVGNLDGTLSLSYADSISSKINLTIDSLSASQGGESYISGLPVSLRETSTLYPDEELLKLNNGYLGIHGLKLNLTGLIKNWSQTPIVNLQIKSSSDNFGDLLQLLPESYSDYTKDLKTKGSLALNGTVKGKITGEKLPAFDIKMDVINGYIKDPDLTEPIRDIRFIAQATNQLLTIDTLHAIAGSNKLSGSARLDNPLEDDGAFRASFLADVDLSTVHQFYDLSQMDIDKLSGQLHTNASISGHLDRMENMRFNGKAILADGLMKYKNIPKALTPINININGSQKLLNIQQLSLHAGDNSISANGTIRNLADEDNRRINLDVNMQANLAALKNYYPIESDSMQLKGTLTANAQLNGKAAEIEHAIQNGSMTLKNVAITGKAISEPVTNLTTNLKLSPSKATLKTFKANIGSSDIHITGSLTHYLSFLTGETSSKEIPTLTGHFTSNFLNLDELMPQSSEDTTSFYPQLPDLNTNLSATIKQLKIAGITMKNLVVQASTTPTQVHMNKASVQLFSGKASGTLSWKIPDGDPSTFHFKGALDSLQLKSFFKQFQILGENSTFYKYISGSFSADVNYSSKLNLQLSPIISTSALEGSFGMSQAKVSGHPVQKKLFQFTHINALKDLSLDSWTSHISIKDKVLTLKDLSITSNNIGMELNGTEQLVSGLTNFHVSLHLPPKLNKALGSVVNGQISSLLTQPDGSLLVPLKLSGSYNNLGIKLDKNLIQSRLKEKGKDKAKNVIKGLFNRFKNKSKSTKKDTTNADSSAASASASL